jgi:hypothetical protein
MSRKDGFRQKLRNSEDAKMGIENLNVPPS